LNSNNQFLLFKTRRFWPLFVTQFLGAFHDNVFKNALVVMLLFDTATDVQNAKLLTTLAAGVFICPFVIFSALGGQLADKFAKDRVISVIKLAEIGIAVLGVVSLLSDSIILSFITLFALGTHSAFFSPSKYAILPQHLETRELIGGNALVNTGTFLAILLGTIAGTILTTLPAGKFLISALLVVAAICGFITAQLIPSAPPKAPNLKLNFNFITETWEILRQTCQQSSRIVRCILGIAWFWFLGAMFIAQLPNFTREGLNADEHVLSLFLILFSVGIAIGGLLNNHILRGRVEAVYVPLAMLGITIFSCDLYISSYGVITNSNTLQGLGAFISHAHNWRIIVDIFAIAVCGGLFVVPLNAIVQHLTAEEIRARILAGSAILNALMMVVSSILSAIFISAGLAIAQIFLIFAIANIIVTLYIRKKISG
jgi:MFS family permease